MTTQPTSNFWSDAVNTGESLFSKIKSSLTPPSSPSITATPKASPSMQFKVGEGLNPVQTKVALQKIREPDSAMNEAQNNSFWGTLSNTVKGIVEPTPTKVRLPFQTEAKDFNAPPIITEPAKFGFGLLEAIPKATAILGGEFKAGFKPEEVKSNIDLRRFGFETPNYVTASKEFTDAVNKGADPLSTGMRIVSDKTLNLAFGFGLLSDAAALSSRVLLSGGPEARIEAQQVVDAYKQNQKALFEKVKDAPLAEREKVLSDLANTKAQAEKVLAEQGSPTVADRARVNTSRYTDILARNTKVGENFWSDFAKPDISPKNPTIKSPYIDPLQLGGSREVPSQAPAFGLSTRAVENTGEVPYPSERYDTPEVIAAREANTSNPITQDINTPERVALREEIANNIYDNSTKTMGRRLDIVTGGPGSRKSSLIAEPLAKQHGSIITDSDVIKNHLPEFNGRNTGSVHLESSKINAQVIFKALKDGVNIVYPTLGDNVENLNKIIDKAKASGYEVHLHNASLSLDKSIPGLLERLNNTGRFVDPQFAHKVGLRPSGVHDILKNDERITTATKYSTEVKRGDTAVPIEKVSKTETPKVNESQRLDSRGKESNGGNPRLNKIIPKDLEPLAAEARKYKSAEEFKNRIKDLVMKQKSGIELLDDQKSFLNALKNPIINKLKPSELFLKLKNGDTDFYNKAVEQPTQRDSVPFKSQGDTVPPISKAESVNAAAERAKAGEDFGPRKQNKVQVSDEGIRLARKSPRVIRSLDKAAVDKLTSNPNATRVYRETLQQIGEVLESRKSKTTGSQESRSLLEDLEPFPSSPDSSRTPLQNQNLDHINTSLPNSVAEVMAAVNPPGGRGGVTPPKLDFLKWKDKSALSLSRETLERNLEDIAGKDDKDKIKKFIIDPIRKNETARIDFLNKLRAEVRKKIVGELSIRAKSEGSKFIQKFGERQFGETVKDNIDNLQMERPNDWYNIKEGAEYIRSLYDKLLDMVNAERQRFGYAPIPKHEDYFRHFQEMDTTIKNFGLILREQDLPTEIAGMTGIFNPGKPFSTAELRRRGELGSTEDAVSGLDNYLDSISKQIYHIDSIQRARTTEKYIRESAKAISQFTSLPSEQIKLPNFVSNLHDYGNMLAGKKSQLDRAFESVIGRRIYTITNWIRGRVSANMVGGNVASAITNFIPFTQSLSTTSKPAAIHGISDALTAPFKDNFNEVDGVKSDFLTRRFPDKAIDLRGLKNISEKANWVFEAIDKFTAKSIVAGKYYEGKNKGLTSEAAMKEANEYAGRVLADRSFGQLPNLFNTKSLGFLTQFQTEVNNAFSFALKDIPKYSEGSKAKLFNAIAQFILYSYLFNNVYQKITGRRPTIDPAYAALTILGMTDQSEGLSFGKRLWAATEDLGGNLPFTGLFLQGGRLPVSAGIPDFIGLLKGTANLKEELEKPAYYFLPPFGGGQIKKTIEGLNANNDGAVFSPSGNFQYKAPETTFEKVQAALFGKYASKSAQDYFNRSNIQSKEQAPIKKIYDEVQKLKASGNVEAGQKIVDGLSDDDYEVYKTIRTNAKRADTVQAEKDMIKTVININKLVSEGKSEEAQGIVNDMTDEEYRIYQLAKKKIK